MEDPRAVDEIFAQSMLEAVTEMRGLLKSTEARDKVHAARTLGYLDALHKRTKLMEARTNAYIERCKALNERTARTPASPPYRDRQGVGSSPSSSDSSPSASDNPNSRNSSAHSASSAVNTDFVPTKGDPRKKRPFGADLYPGDTDPHTGWVVPEEHICQIRKDAPENHVMAHCMLPGYKTKADLERAVYTFIDRDNRIYNELKAAQSELNVFRSERLGSISLEKREELLAGRFEKNNKRRQVYGTPTFLAELPQLTPELLNAKPVPPLEEFLPSATGAGSPSLPSPTAANLHSLPSPTGEMSRGSASDREGKSSTPDAERSRRAGREGVSSATPHNSNSFSAPPPCPSANSVVNAPLPSSATSACSAVKEVLSPLAAARRAAGKRPLPPQPPRLNHPPPPTPRAPRPPRDNCYNYLDPDST